MKQRLMLSKVIKIIIPVVILSLVLFEGKKQLEQIRAGHLLFHLRMLSFEQIGCMILIGLIATLSMILYDEVITRQIGLKLPFLSKLKYGWIANTFNNTIGFGGFAGASLRSLFYKKHYENAGEIISTLIWLSPLTLSGLSIFAWLPLLGIINIRLLTTTHWWLPIILLGVALYAPGYLIFWIYKKRKESSSPDFVNMLGMVLASVIEWFFALLTIWTIIELIGLSIAFQKLFAIFTVAGVVGVISMLPGGIGSFDLMMLIGLELYGIPSSSTLIILLLYRFVYFIVPWLIGLVLASTEVLAQTKHFIGISPTWQKRVDLWRHYSIYPISIFAGLSQWALSALIFMSGLLLLLSAAIPGMISRIKTAEAILSAPIMTFSNQLSVAMGITLLILSRSLFHRVKRAHTITFIVLILGATFTFSKGLDYEEALILLAMAFLLWTSRKRFYRESYPITWGAILSTAIVITIVIVFYPSIGFLNRPYLHLHLNYHLKSLLVWRPKALFMSGVYGSIIAIGILLFGFRIKPLKKANDVPYINHDKVKQILETYGGNVLSHLAFLKDKVLFWNKNEDSFIMYRKTGDKLVALGDPIGNKESFIETITEFLEYADQYGFTPVFYQVEKENLSLYHEAGYQFFKLGEEAYVNLETFTLSGKRNQNLRTVKNKFAREGYSFEWVEPPFSDSLINELQRVSDEWLAGRKEKGFSLGFFDKEYIEESPVGLLKSEAGHVIAFATTMSSYDNNTTLSIDLMRHLIEVPNGAMDMIFISLIEMAQSRGYKKFNLGMAPLSNVGISRYSFWGERVASQIFSHGNFFYQFQGLRRYKEKFASDWEPKYLAFRGRISLPVAMLQISILIGKKKKD